MTEQAAIKEFARLLADADENGRKTLLKRAQMVAMNMADPEAFEPPIRTLGEYLAAPIEIPPVLVEPRILVRGGVTARIGRAGKGKTVAALNQVLKWAAGEPWFNTLKDRDGGHLLAPTDGPLKTLIIENEGAAGMFHFQIGLMASQRSYLPEAQRALALDNVLIWGDGGYSGLKLDDPKKLDEVRAGCEKFSPDLVFIEPFRGLWKGEENSATEMGVVADALVELASDYNCAVMLSHHERKAGPGEDGEKMSAGRGSTVLEGVVAAMENFEGVKGGDYRELSWSKVRYSTPGREAPAPVRLDWDKDAWWYRHVSLDQIEQSLLDVVARAPEPVTIHELAEETEEKVTKVRKHVRALVEQGRLKELPSSFSGEGSTGKRYVIPGDAEDEGLGF